MKKCDWTASYLAVRVPCSASFIRMVLNDKSGMSDAMWERIKSLPPDALPVKRKRKA